MVTGRIGDLCRPSCHGGCGRPRGIRLLIDNGLSGTDGPAPFARFGLILLKGCARNDTAVRQVTNG